MSLDLLQTFRVLSSFAPPHRSLAEAPWEAYVDWAIGEGLAPLAAYNLEYRLAGADAPEWARDRLLSVYQGTLNDSVMKLVNFKRAVAGLEGCRVILFGGAAFVESLYPHLAFRPLLDLRLLLKPEDLGPVIAVLRKSDFKSEAPGERRPRAAAVLSDGRSQILLYTALLARSQEDAGLFERALPVRVYGPSLFRLDQEDAILVACLEQARAGFEVPLLWFVDLRELLTGASAVEGPYSRACNFAVLRRRAASCGLERALYVSVSVTRKLFPEAEAAAHDAKPRLGLVTRLLLEKWIVQRLADVRPDHRRGPVGPLGLWLMAD